MACLIHICDRSDTAVAGLTHVKALLLHMCRLRSLVTCMFLCTMASYCNVADKAYIDIVCCINPLPIESYLWAEDVYLQKLNEGNTTLVWCSGYKSLMLQ